LKEWIVENVPLQDIYLRARSGNQDDENKLFQVLRDKFQAIAEYKIGDSMAAADIVQTALVSIADKYRRIEMMDDIAPWAHRVLLNHVMHYFREKQLAAKRQNQLSDKCAASPPTHNPDPLLKMRLRLCLKKLNQVNPRHARILNFCYQGFATDEICEKLAISRNVMYISLSRARAMLRQCLKEGGITHE